MGRPIRRAPHAEDPFVALYGQRPFPPEHDVDHALALYLASEGLSLGTMPIACGEPERASSWRAALVRRLASLFRRRVAA